MNLGAFELGEPIGEGGMGSVWLGRHIEAGVDVAIKVMHPEVMNDPEYRQAFDTEIRSVASLRHPHIVTILDFGRVPEEVAKRAGETIDAGSPYLVMEYADGGSVEDYFGKIRWPDIRELLLVTLDALAHAHARDVIHRDLKPENILVGCGPDWDVKLTDFGLAHAADRFKDSGKVETAWGTPQYMAPEQLRGLWREYGPWTDLYGLGCMAYELVTGQFAFDGETVVELGQAHIEDPIPAVEPRFEVPRGTEAWIHQMLAKERANRFSHAADAAHALAQLPSLDDSQTFGVLFERQRQSPEETSGFGEATATQLVPDIETTNSFDVDDIDSPGRHQPQQKNWDAPAELPALPHGWQRRREGAISDELVGISLDLFGLRAIPLVDRDLERDRLWQQVHQIHDDGRARQCIVRGAAGTGKSQLVEWLCNRCRELGAARVMTAYHSPVSGPADGLVAMVERFLRCTKLDGDARRNHLADMLIGERLVADLELQTLLSLFDNRRRDGDSQSSGAHQSGRQQRYALLYQFLSAIARQRPLILWLDDVQWGWDALGFARYIQERQRSDPAPLLVVMTARTEALEERTTEGDTLREIAARPGATELDIPPLRRQDTEELVRHLLRLDEELTQHVLERSEGVPLFAVQLVEDWVSRGKLVMGDDGFELRADAAMAIPDDIYQLWDHRLQSVVQSTGEQSLAALEVAAALGQEIDSEEWRQALLKLQTKAPNGLVDRLIDEDLARRMEDGWKFAHGLLCESLERRAIESGRWAKWNEACAEAVSELYDADQLGVAERLAQYWRRADQPQRALQALGIAIDEAIERSDYDHAGELIDWREAMTADDALRWTLETDVDRARLAERRGDYRACAETAEAVASQARQAGHTDLAARASIWAGIGRRELGELDTAQSQLQAAHRHFAESRETEGHRQCLAKTLLELGRVEETGGDFEMARKYFRNGQQAYSKLHHSYGEALCLNGIGDVLRRSGDFEGAHRACLEALERFRSLENITGIADCLDDLAEASRLRGEFDDARQFANEALRLYQALDSRRQHMVRLNLAMIALAEGQFDDAADLLQQLVELFSDHGRVVPLMEATAGLVAADAGCGRWDDFADHLQVTQKISKEADVCTPGVTWALGIARDLADRAGRDDLAHQARSVAAVQSREIRHTFQLPGDSK